MKITLVGGLFLVVAAGVCLAANGTPAEAGGKKGKGQMIAHNVYFSLKDNSPAAREKLVGACKKYLSKHEGIVFFAAGKPTDELKREVNDRDFDVALHIVFDSLAAHDKYQDAPDHHKFINENKDNWKKVRVFDSTVSR
jgi:hypothetical protein